MLQISSSGVSSAVPDETDRTVYRPLSKVKGKKKIEHCRILFYIHSVVGRVFAAHVILQRLS